MFAKNGIPLYIQLKNKLLKDIRENYKPNDIIPAEGEIEKLYNVSRITVRRAIEELGKEGVLVKKQGKGTFVREQKILYDANSIGSLTQRLKKQNHHLSTSSIEFEIITGEHMVKELLNCSTLLCIKRFRLLDDVPFALMLNYFDINTVPNLQTNFKIESLYTFLKEEYALEFFSAEETVGAKGASKEEAQKLCIEEKHPLLSLHRLSFDRNDKAVEFSDILIKADMYKHKIMLSHEKISNI